MQIQDHDKLPKFDHRVLPPASRRSLGDLARPPAIPGMPGMVGSHENWGNFKCHKWGELLRHSHVHVLEDRKPRHQPCGQRRVAGLVRIDRAEPRLEKAPVDRPAELRQRMIEVDDLVKPGPEKIVLPVSRRSLGRIESPSAKPTERQNHVQTRRSICKK